MPLGFDLVEKKLVVNEQEAERVRAIFALYRELGSLLRTAHELNARGWTSKAWTTKRGRSMAGRAWTNTSLHAFLTSPLLIGKIRAGSELVDGQHKAIVDRKTWDEVQAQLSRKSAVPRGWSPPARNGALLRGLLRCACGESMTRNGTRRGGKKYSFYVCSRVLKRGAAACPGGRASAGALDQFVLDRIRVVGRDPKALQATLAADRNARDTRHPQLEADVRRLTQERGRVEGERRNVEEAIAKGAVSMVDRLAELDARLREVDQDLADARRDLAALAAEAINVDELQRALAEFEPLWKQLSTPEQARVLALLIDQIVFDPQEGDVEIRFRPGAPRLLLFPTAP